MAQKVYWEHLYPDCHWCVARIGDDGLPKPGADPEHAVVGDLVCVGTDEAGDDWMPLEAAEYDDLAAYLATRKPGDQVGDYAW